MEMTKTYAYETYLFRFFKIIYEAYTESKKYKDVDGIVFTLTRSGNSVYNSVNININQKSKFCIISYIRPEDSQLSYLVYEEHKDFELFIKDINRITDDLNVLCNFLSFSIPDVKITVNNLIFK